MTDDDARRLANAFVDALLARLAGGAVMGAPQPRADAVEREPKYMKVTDFAKSTGFSRATIQDYVKRGMPSIQLGKRGHRIDVAAAREWLKIGGASHRGHDA